MDTIDTPAEIFDNVMYILDSTNVTPFITAFLIMAVSFLILKHLL